MDGIFEMALPLVCCEALGKQHDLSGNHLPPLWGAEVRLVVLRALLLWSLWSSVSHNGSWDGGRQFRSGLSVLTIHSSDLRGIKDTYQSLGPPPRGDLTWASGSFQASQD